MYKSIRTAIVIMMVMVVFAFTSCSAEMNGNIESIRESVDTAALDAYASRNPGNGTDWRVMRKLALAEYTEVSELLDFGDGLVIEDLPHPVLALDGSVAYWEFRLMRGDECRGFISCVGDKRLGEPIAYISPIIREYGMFTADSDPLYAGSGYPATLLSSEEKNLAGSVTDYDEMELTEEQLAEIVSEQKRIASIWSEIDSYKEDILDTTDIEILSETKSATRVSGKGWDILYAEPYASSWYFVSTNTNYDNPYTGCGIEALGVLLGGYNKAHGVGHEGDFTYISGRRQELCNIWPELQQLADAGLKTKGATWYFEMTSALEKASQGRLTLDLNLIHSFQNVWDAIESSGLPVISLRTGRYIPFIQWDPAWHYRVILGCAKKTTETQHSFLWMKWTTKSTSKYYFCADSADFEKSKSQDKPWVLENPGEADIEDWYRHVKHQRQYWEKAGSYGTNVQFFSVREI